MTSGGMGDMSEKSMQHAISLGVQPHLYSAVVQNTLNFLSPQFSLWHGLFRPLPPESPTPLACFYLTLFWIPWFFLLNT